MTPPFCLPMSRAVAVISAVGGWLVTASCAHAGALTVNVTDVSGKPLADAVALLEPTGARVPTKPMADAELSQSKRQFHPRVTLVTVGTRVNFPNFDTVRHHVYSFSAPKTFELKLYAGVPAAPVLFDKPGIAVIGCNIHDQMAAWIVVAETPWAGRSAENGRIRLDNVPAGAYQLRVWHPGFAPGSEPGPAAVSVGTADAERSVRLQVSDGS